MTDDKVLTRKPRTSVRMALIALRNASVTAQRNPERYCDADRTDIDRAIALIEAVRQRSEDI